MCDRRWLIGLLALASAMVLAAEPAREEIGQSPSDAELRAADITVLPNGEGLPAGSGTAKEGRGAYEQRCAVCHGFKAEGLGDYPALVGGIGTLGTAKPQLTVGSYWPYATTLWDYIRRAMPYESPGSLSDKEVYAVTAWLLHANGIIKENTTLDQRSLPRIRMPNRDGFVADPRPDVATQPTQPRKEPAQ